MAIVSSAGNVSLSFRDTKDRRRILNFYRTGSLHGELSGKIKGMGHSQNWQQALESLRADRTHGALCRAGRRDEANCRREASLAITGETPVQRLITGKVPAQWTNYSRATNSADQPQER